VNDAFLYTCRAPASTDRLPREEDVLLVWSHGLTIAGRSEGVRLNGITFLPGL
jgi:hypothetical protein